MSHHGWPSLPIVLCALGFTSALAAPASAGVLGSPMAPHQMVAQYFTDLNAHGLRAAWLLEAPCGISFSVSNGPGAPTGTEGYAGKSAWALRKGKNARHPILASAHVTAIKRLRIPVLERNHILAYGVAGWFRFDYSALASQASLNNKHKSGFHVIKLGMWKCNGRWGIEPSYWLFAGGGELNWT